MQQKWVNFAIGALSGLVVVLTAALIHSHRAYDAQAFQVDNQSGGKFALAVGGSEAQRTDMLWVLTEHPALVRNRRDEEEDGPKVIKQNMLSLCLYKITRNGDSMKLIAARDINYDIEFTDMGTENPKVKEVIAEIKRNMPKPEKK